MFELRIRELRIEKELSQKELADILEVSKSTIGMYEQGRRMPDADKLDKMANIFGVSIDYLLGRTDRKNYETEHTAFHTTSVEGLDDADIAIVESLIQQLKEKHKK